MGHVMGRFGHAKEDYCNGLILINIYSDQMKQISRQIPTLCQ